jgi:lysophospholipid acyltransferase (LPLAT)-like uncharacterized protein
MQRTIPNVKIYALLKKGENLCVTIQISKVQNIHISKGLVAFSPQVTSVYSVFFHIPKLSRTIKLERKY